MHRNESLRLKGYDYTNGAFFVTLITHNRLPLFGEIIDKEFINSEFGDILEKEWLLTGEMRPHFELDTYQIMPNHFHAIVFLYSDIEKKQEFKFTQKLVTKVGMGPKSGTLGTTLGIFKGAVTRKLNAARKTPGAPVWQADYYERVIRNYEALYRISQYIKNNPAKYK